MLCSIFLDFFCQYPFQVSVDGVVQHVPRSVDNSYYLVSKRFNNFEITFVFTAGELDPISPNRSYELGMLQNIQFSITSQNYLKLNIV